MSIADTVVVSTFESRERILGEGGTSGWRLDPAHARRCTYVVCTRNAGSARTEGREPHHSAFLIGKVSDVVALDGVGLPGRYRIEFSEYALVDLPDVWKGDRNPVRYARLEDLGIDLSTAKWQSVTRSTFEERPQPPARRPHAALSLAEAKRGLALTFGVPLEAVEITIRA